MGEDGQETWSNNREGDDLVKEKIDRVFCSLEWLMSYPSAEVYALPPVGSDHCPLLLQARPPSHCSPSYMQLLSD